ncbi:cation:proton antiporter [bacterium]|nr:cation:proton antiporter [bacterium]
MAYSLQVLLVLCIIIAAAKITGSLFVRWGQPGVLGEILIGLILGPTLLNLPAWGIFADQATYRHELEALSHAAKNKQLIAYVEESQVENTSEHEQSGLEHEDGNPTSIDSADETEPQLTNIIEGHDEHYYHVLHNASSHGGLLSLIKELAAVGVILLMFIAGMETDLKRMKKVGLVALFAAIGGVLLPFFSGWGIAEFMGHYNIYESIFVGTILTATSVSISAQTLIELKALQTKEGTTILGAAVIDDVLGIIILSLVIAFKPQGTGAAGHGVALPDILSKGIGGLMNMDDPAISKLKVAFLIIFMVAFFIAAWIIGTKYFEKWTERVRKWPTAEAMTAFAIFICLFYSWAAEWAGSVAAITGAYLAGLLFAQTRFKHDIERNFSVVTYAIFVPIFFVSIGLDADARPLVAPVVALVNGKGIPGVENPGMGIFWLTMAIAVGAVVTKIIGCYLGALLKGFSSLSSIRVGVGMVSRGEVGLIVASVGLAAGIISRDIFTIMIIMVLVTTLVTPVLLKIAFAKSEPSDNGNNDDQLK